MLVHTITSYLAAHRRLVVPQLGTFAVKEPGRSIVFTELLRQDDGVLRGLLVAGGMSPLEAAGTVDRFVFEARHAVSTAGRCELDGLGVLLAGPGGMMVFEYAPGTAARPVGAPAAQGSGGRDARSVRPETTPAASSPAPAADAAPHVTPSSRLNPEPCVRGLRYGRPEKTTDAFTYVNRTPRRGFDKLLLLAIVAAVIALAAIAYGYYRQAVDGGGLPFFGSGTEQPAPEAPGDEPTDNPLTEQ